MSHKAVVRLKPRRASPFLNRHPWVFAGAIDRVSGNPQPGDEVLLQTHDAQFVARGLFNPHSSIRVRLYAWEEDQPLDDAFLHARLKDALALRQTVLDCSQTDSYRLVFSESDGLSGLTVDRYGDWLMVQLTSLALATRQESLLDALQELVQPRGIILKSDAALRDLEQLELKNGLVRGEAPPESLFIRENGLRFQVDLLEGQKTGYFLDQRDNRLAVSRLVHGQRVLDAFCYAGGFGVTAARRGSAAAVVCVDTSEAALKLAEANATVNEVRDRMQFVRSDVFRYLEDAKTRGEQFDVVILDPPKMARNRSSVENALRGYHGLNVLGTSVLKPGGLLVTCSCSGLVSREQFTQMLAEVATTTHRPVQILEARGHAPDHPVSPNCPETEYLKCFICRVG